MRVSRNSEAQRDIPGPRWAAEPYQGQGERSRSSRASKPSPVGPREGNKGPETQRRRRTTDLPRRGPAPRPPPDSAARILAQAQPADGAQRPRLPLPQALTLALRTKQLRSSSKQAAGRAWPGRGPRVPRKPQAAQVEPGRRHRKSRVSSLPFLRGDPVTRKREVPPSGGSQRGSRPQHAAPQTLRFKARSARSCRRQRGEAASIASRAGAGEGSAERRAGRLGKAAPVEAERTPPGRPARGHLGRCGGRPAARGDDGGAGLPRRSATAVLSQASRRPNRRAVNPRAPPAAGSRTLRPSRPARATPESGGTEAAVSQAGARRSGHPSSGLVRRITQLFTGTLHSEPGNSVCAARSGVIPRCRWEN